VKKIEWPSGAIVNQEGYPMKIPYRILCVCMGNVCRSPTAEAVLKRLLSDSDLRGRIEVASAGCMVIVLVKQRCVNIAGPPGYVFQIRAQKSVGRTCCFDLILVMDKSTLQSSSHGDEISKAKPGSWTTPRPSMKTKFLIPTPPSARVLNTLDMIEDAAKGWSKDLKNWCRGESDSFASTDGILGKCRD
jgi:protein-tyrosine phosphatase